ncbi:hypothetical protein FB639_003598 [Coemansia asiatica]|nr:hypothetical protein FB639_003598 [Coemansia asiatica]
MAPFLSTFVGGAVGLVTGMYSIGLQGRTLLKRSYLGFKYYQFKQHEGQLIEKRREVLLEKRAQRLASARADAEN